MKCYASRHALNANAMAAAQLLTKQLMEEQSDRVAARCYNEVWCAMLQADLSPRTIHRVQKALAEAVLPKLDGMYVPENKRQLDNVQNIADGDLWVKNYLTEHGVNVWAVQEASDAGR